MKLDYAFFAQSAEITRDGRLNVFGGEFKGMRFVGFPVNAEFCLVLKLLDSPSEVGSHKLVLTCAAKGGGQTPDRIEGVHELSVTTKPDNVNPDDNTGAIVIAQIGIGFQTPGVYEFQVVVDGEHLRSIPFHVFTASAAGAGSLARPTELAKG